MVDLIRRIILLWLPKAPMLVVDDDDDRRKIIRSGVRFVFGNEACPVVASPNLFLRGTT